MKNKFAYVETIMGGAFDPEIIEHQINLKSKKAKKIVFSPWSGGDDLKDWLAPIDLKFFNENILGKIPYVFNLNDPARFEKFMTLERFTQIFNENRILENNASYIDKNLGKISKPSYSLAHHIFDNSGSVVVNQLPNCDHILGKLNDQIEMWSNHHVNINAYLTPAGGRSFDWHWDTHDVFMLQIHGSKDWEVYEPVIHLPLPQHQAKDFHYFQKKHSRLIKKLTLKKGQMLYLPRGYGHQGKSTSEAPSLHLTIGIFPLMWHELVAKIVSKALIDCELDVDFRGEINIDTNRLLKSDNKKILQNLLKKFYKKINIKHLNNMIDVSQLQDLGRNPLLNNEKYWKCLSSNKKIRNDTYIKQSGIKFVVRNQPQISELIYGDVKLCFPKAYFNALRFLKNHQILQVSKIPLKGLPVNGRIKLAKLLCSKGLFYNQSVDL
jgi:hypothetical protein